MRIEVAAHLDGPPTTHAIVLRNMLREVEIFLPGTLLLTLDGEAPLASPLSLVWIAMAFAIPLATPRRTRLGDILAGTRVIELSVPVLLPDVSDTSRARPAQAPGFAFLPHRLDHDGRFRPQTLEGFLRVQDTRTGAEQGERGLRTLACIAERVREKVGHADAVAPADPLAFLRTFYDAQRAHLERQQLFGNRRADERHKEKGATTGAE